MCAAVVVDTREKTGKLGGCVGHARGGVDKSDTGLALGTSVAGIESEIVADDRWVVLNNAGGGPRRCESRERLLLRSLVARVGSTEGAVLVCERDVMALRAYEIAVLIDVVRE